MRTTLEKLGHKQGPTPRQFDNLYTAGITNDRIKHQRLNVMDMCFIGYDAKAVKNILYILQKW